MLVLIKHIILGIAISSDGTMYLADGTNIRVINRHGIIHTLIGHHKHNNIWQPMPCKTAVPTSQVCKTQSVLIITLFSL